MIKSIKIISFCFIILSIFIIAYLYFINKRSIVVQNKIIDSVFSIDNYEGEYLGYISIPKFNVKRVIKRGTSLSILDDLFVGLYEESSLFSNDLIILAGHNVPIVFSKLHEISIDDSVFLINNRINRRFDVYDIKIVREDDFSFFNNRNNELLLITCTDVPGYRLLVFLKEIL